MTERSPIDAPLPAPSQVRETFTRSREGEYLNELDKQIGYSEDLFLLATVKEAVDNALDHCEEIGRLPEIRIEVADDKLVIQDNGDGIPPSVVASMLDFATKTSSRALYRGLTRGAMGNAGKCIVAVPYVLSGDAKQGRSVITARGVRHEIVARLDALTGTPTVDYRQEDEKVQIGTKVEIALPHLPCLLTDSQKAQFVLFCRHAVVLNPHLSLSLRLPCDAKHEWTRTVEFCPKWTAAEPDPPGWHDIESFERLVGAAIQKDRSEGSDRRLRDFLRQFAGLKRSQTLADVLGDTKLPRANLSALLNCDGLDRTKIASLLAAMQLRGKTPKPEKLGAVGKRHIEASFAARGVVESTFKYKKIVGQTAAGLPLVVEAAFADLTSGDRTIITGINFSPSIDEPVVRMLDGLLEHQRVDDEAAVVFMLHIAQVEPTFLNRGKSVCQPCAELAAAIRAATLAVTQDYCRRRKREEKDAAAREKWLDRQIRKRPAVNMKEAVIAVLPEAVRKASGNGVCEFSDRDLYYAARELVQQHTDAALTQSYFDKIVDEWEIAHGLIDGRLRDPRGFLQEPHTGRRIPLGTKSVDDYEIPLYLYDTILYVEKKGMLSKFELGRIGERFDCAIMASEGYAVRAAKALIDAAQRGHKMKVLCFHDADPDGYNIARKLAAATGAHRYDIEIIDVGLHLPEAIKMGLSTETFTRKKSLPKALEFTKLERDYFTGQERYVIGRNGKRKKHWINCRRVELNALSADPHAFVAWVVKKLKKYGVAEKLVPPKKVILARARAQREAQLRELVEAKLMEALDLDARIEAITRQLLREVEIDGVADVVARWSKKKLPEPWTKCVDSVVSRAVGGIDDHVHQHVRSAV